MPSILYKRAKEKTKIKKKIQQRLTDDLKEKKRLRQEPYKRPSG